MPIELSRDLRQFIELCLSEKVEFLLVGGYALAYHGAPRFTEDIDLFVATSPENAAALIRVLDGFGFGSLDLEEADFLAADQIVQLGRAPNRVDLLTGIDGVPWEDAWRSRERIELDGLEVFVISEADLIRNKQAAGRPQDLADVHRLLHGRK